MTFVASGCHFFQHLEEPLTPATGVHASYLERERLHHKEYPTLPLRFLFLEFSDRLMRETLPYLPRLENKIVLSLVAAFVVVVVAVAFAVPVFFLFDLHTALAFSSFALDAVAAAAVVVVVKHPQISLQVYLR